MKKKGGRGVHREDAEDTEVEGNFEFRMLNAEGDSPPRHGEHGEAEDISDRRLSIFHLGAKRKLRVGKAE